MSFSKKEISEIIDGDDNIIGVKGTPEFDNNQVTKSNGTTDKNVMIGTQNYKNDFLGRFGFSFYESEEDNKNLVDGLAKIMYSKYLETLDHYKNNPNKLESDWKLHQNHNFENQPEDSREHDYEWASDIMKYLEPHLKKDINESVVVEDKLSNKKDSDKSVGEKNKKDDLSKKDKIEMVADLLSKLPPTEINKLTNLLEAKRELDEFASTIVKENKS